MLIFVGFPDLYSTLTILTPPIETPDPPNDTPGASKQVVLTPHDIPRILRLGKIQFYINFYFMVLWMSD